LDEFEPATDPVNEMLVEIQDDRGEVQDDDLEISDEDLMAEELVLIGIHLCVRRRRTKKIHEQGWQAVNPKTGRQIGDWWTTKEELFTGIWKKAGTDWRLVFKTKNLPVPRPSRILGRIQ
jgi:hypothetical protein